LATWSNLDVLGLKLESPVYFFDDEHMDKNLLGRAVGSTGFGLAWSITTWNFTSRLTILSHNVEDPRGWMQDVSTSASSIGYKFMIAGLVVKSGRISG
jgi:hypothetical protein